MSKRFEFTITRDVTMSATVTVEADTIEQAQEIALASDFYSDPAKARFELDDGNSIRDVYLPDPTDYKIVA